ncbi:MAG: hypothetical protein L3J38_06910, partial [Thiomicrorhabdus sp.]|nr:hypothetical protein [Thiomicrorhabdus sp.]
MMLSLKLRTLVNVFKPLFSQVKMSVVFCLILFSSPLWAELTIEISEGYDNAIPIAIVPFGFEKAVLPVATSEGQEGEQPSNQPSEKNPPPSLSPDSAPLDLAQVVAANLRRSGQFKPLLNSSMPSYPTSIEQIEFRQWRPLDIDNMLIGKLVDQGDGFYQVDMRFMDVLRKKQVLGKRWNQ